MEQVIKIGRVEKGAIGFFSSQPTGNVVANVKTEKVNPSHYNADTP